jgi:hypothetical protein
MSQEPTNQTTDSLKRLWKCSRPDGYGCHEPGERRRTNGERTRMQPIEGSKSQKRKKNYGNHTPHQN